MKTFIQNNQNTVQINVPAIKILTAKLANYLAQADPGTTWGDLSVVLTDDRGIIQANREFFGRDHPTDVISFRYDPIPGEENAITGDLIVNVECAQREGPAHNGADAELAFYIAHGFDHLSGSEDDTPQKRAAMHRTEKKWLKDLHPIQLFKPTSK